MTGRRISFTRGDKRLSARVMGIGDSGELLIKRASGVEMALTSGEVCIEGLTFDGGGEV
jgi:biotin-(acetyl-CoA carboxylase) ligase